MNEHEYEGMKRKIETMNMETIKKNGFKNYFVFYCFGF